MKTLSAVTLLLLLSLAHAESLACPDLSGTYVVESLRRYGGYSQGPAGGPYPLTVRQVDCALIELTFSPLPVPGFNPEPTPSKTVISIDGQVRTLGHGFGLKWRFAEVADDSTASEIDGDDFPGLIGEITNLRTGRTVGKHRIYLKNEKLIQTYFFDQSEIVSRRVR